VGEAAYARTSKPKRKRIRTPEIVYTVAPSDAIDDRVKVEIEKAEQILRCPSALNIFNSPYLISAVYYHDGFLAAFPADKADADPARRIVGHVTRALTPERKRELIDLMRDVASEYAPQPERSRGLVTPVDEPQLGKRRRRRPPHQTAVDLFAPEGTPVRSASSGVVVLSESNWNLTDPFSTTSQKGGNSVIIFDPMTYRFYRYAHLENAIVTPGAFVSAGQPIGHLGHSGLNASRPKHGRHLHFEINEYDGRTVRTLKYTEIRKMLDLSR
jgi:murein DD-endopeptidase MepM/ murein hydrolase activator NlpD